jgi:hypothetical protein
MGDLIALILMIVLVVFAGMYLDFCLTHVCQ